MTIRGCYVIKVPHMMQWHVFSLDRVRYLGKVSAPEPATFPVRVTYLATGHAIPFATLPEAIEYLRTKGGEHHVF